MFSKRFIATWSSVAISALLLGSCTSSGTGGGTAAPNPFSQIGNIIPQMGDALTGQDYALAIPDFYENVNPYIVDQAAFSEFMRKYKDKMELTEFEEAEVLVKIGAPQTVPEWITPRGRSIINKYYKDAFAEKRAEIFLDQFARSKGGVEDVNWNVTLAQVPIVQIVRFLAIPLLVYAASPHPKTQWSSTTADLSGRLPAIAYLIKMADLTMDAAKSLNDDKDKSCAQTSGCVAPQLRVKTEDGQGDGSNKCAEEIPNALNEAQFFLGQPPSIMIIPSSKIGDPRYKGMGWEKWAYDYKKGGVFIQIHYLFQRETGTAADMKVKFCLE